MSEQTPEEKRVGLGELIANMRVLLTGAPGKGECRVSERIPGYTIRAWANPSGGVEIDVWTDDELLAWASRVFAYLQRHPQDTAAAALNATEEGRR
jgi:hypothetical protein